MVTLNGWMRILSVSLLGTLGCAAGVEAAPNSGLDLTQPLLQAGVSYQSTYFYPGAVGSTRAFTASIPLTVGQLKVAFPFGRHPYVASNTGVSDKGDAFIVSYNYILPARTANFRQTFGLAFESPSGGASSSGEQQIAPLYQLAYRVNNAASILVLAKYTVGYNATASSARYNELTLSPSALISLRANTYAALTSEYHRYSGYRNDTTYDSILNVGRLFSGFNVRAYYGLPLGIYSYRHLFRSSYGLSTSIQL